MKTQQAHPWWRNIVLALVGAFVVLYIAGGYAWRKYHPPFPFDPYQMSHVILGNQTVAVRIPVTRAKSELGLGGVTSLPDTEGMLWGFEPPSQPTFWMKGMKIGLDFIWIRNNVVAAIDANVPPPTMSLELPLYEPKENVDHVLEVAAGFSARHHVQIGDHVTIDSP